MINEKLLIVLISGSVSLLISFIAFLVAKKRMRHENEKLIREFKDAYSHKLYEQRVALYPKGYSIAGQVLRRKTPQLIPEAKYLEKIRFELNAWIENEAGLFLSIQALKSYWEFRVQLQKSPARHDGWTEEQANNLMAARDKFRKSLREDLGNLYDDEGKTELPGYF